HAQAAGHRLPQAVANVDRDLMVDTVDVEVDLPHRRRQLSCLTRWLGWLRGLLGRRSWLSCWGRRNCDGRAAWPGLNGWCGCGLAVSARDGDARTRDDANCNRTYASADQEVASGR